MAQAVTDEAIVAPVNNHESRRLASDYLVGLVRNSEYTRQTSKRIASGCSEELTAYCASDVMIVRALIQAGPNTHEGALVDALRNVGVCLAKNADSLSQYCMDTMVRELVIKNNAGATPPLNGNGNGNDAGPQWPVPAGGGGADNNRNGDHWQYEGNTHDRGVRGRQWGGGDDDSSSDLEVYIVNHHGGRGHGPHHHRGGHGGRVSAAVWVIILPFFCLGLYVVVKHGIAYMKKRRATFMGVMNGEYVPLKTETA
jgi:hypothetical protein